MEGIWGDIADWLAGLLLLGGSAFYVLGMIGLNRFPDVFTRMHAVSVSETLGVGLLFLGMMLISGFTLVTVKLLFMLILILFSGPVIGHALARAALHDGQKPLLARERGRLVATAPEEVYPELRERLRDPLISETADDDMPTATPTPTPTTTAAEGGAPSNS